MCKTFPVLRTMRAINTLYKTKTKDCQHYTNSLSDKQKFGFGREILDTVLCKEKWPILRMQGPLCAMAARACCFVTAAVNTGISHFHNKVCLWELERPPSG